MSHGYRLIQWNAYKRRYDATLLSAILIYLAIFFLVGKIIWRGTHAISDEILLIRATGTCAFILLNLILCIGPLARLGRRFLPLLYNRRHMGVTTFFVGLIHALLTVGYYHGFAKISPVVSLLTSNTQYRSISAFPFEILGLAALGILFVMAATSHDFWLNTLSPRVWKSLHMLVYVAWALLVMHVALGALQSERSLIYTVFLLLVVTVVPTLHLIAGWRELRRERRESREWIDACGVDEIPESRAKVIAVRHHERVAIFRFGGRFSAVSNVCAHQSGPLGEGRIVNGCITCPWHGYQYRPQDGCAPPPFTEKLPTYQLRIEGNRLMLHLRAQPPGTALELPSVNSLETAHV